jgi:hypothetical protein
MVLHQVWESTRSHFTTLLRSRLVKIVVTKKESLRPDAIRTEAFWFMSGTSYRLMVKS